MGKIELSIIIVDYKSTGYTIRLVSDLLKKLSGQRYEIIVVDNDPTSKADKIFRQKFAGSENVKIIKAKENRGFGFGNNLGAQNAGGEYLLILNPDTEIIDSAIEEMLDFLFKHSEIGAVTPAIYQPGGKNPQHHFFGRFQNLSNLIFRNQAGKLPAKFLSLPAQRESVDSDFFYTEMISAAALMIKRDLFEKVGGFDQRFFMYMEDEDLCRRIVKTGVKNAVLASAKIIHFEGQSSTPPEKKKYYYKSQDYYWQKHYGKFQTLLMKIIRAPYILLQRWK